MRNVFSCIITSLAFCKRNHSANSTNYSNLHHGLYCLFVWSTLEEEVLFYARKWFSTHKKRIPFLNLLTKRLERLREYDPFTTHHVFCVRNLFREKIWDPGVASLIKSFAIFISWILSVYVFTYLMWKLCWIIMNTYLKVWTVPYILINWNIGGLELEILIFSKRKTWILHQFSDFSSEKYINWTMNIYLKILDG